MFTNYVPNSSHKKELPVILGFVLDSDPKVML
jgi:hypothetical protein